MVRCRNLLASKTGATRFCHAGRSTTQRGLEVGFEAVEKGFLAAEDFFAGGGEVEPFAAIGFGNFDLAAGAWGPFYEAGVGDEGSGIEVAFDGPCGDFFAGGLCDDAEGEKVGVRTVDGEGRAGFFLKFAAGGFEGRFGGEIFAFRDGPGVFSGPEGAAGVDEEDFRARGRAAVEEEAGGGFGHGGARIIIGYSASDNVLVAGALSNGVGS